MTLVDQVRADLDSAPISAKLRSLLRIAGAVQISGRNVTTQLVADARAEGATDLEIHDTVLIAAAFCMFNRYVDGLATTAPETPRSTPKPARSASSARATCPHRPSPAVRLVTALPPVPCRPR